MNGARDDTAKTEREKDARPKVSTYCWSAEQVERLYDGPLARGPLPALRASA